MWESGYTPTTNTILTTKFSNYGLQTYKRKGVCVSV